MAEELNNPLFDDEREFLERKKEEYERALRGDVDHIKEQSVQVGKVAAVGAGLAGTIWLISKLFGGKKRKAKKQHDRLRAAQAGSRGRDAYYNDADDEFELDDEAFALDRSAEFRDEDEHDAPHHDTDRNSGARSARESAQVFMAQDTNIRHQVFEDQDQDTLFGETAEYDYDTARDQDFDNGFDSGADRQHDGPADVLPAGRLDFGPAVHLHRQGQQPAGPEPVRAYDDSRRLPASTDFSAGSGSHYPEPPADNSSRRQKSFGQQASNMMKSFLETGTGKAVAAQVSALALAYVAKLVNDKLPMGTLGKNADLADAPATTSFYPPAAPASSASTPAVSLTFTDAPTEHPTSK